MLHTIEEAVRVYLLMGPQGWVVDPVAVDGGALFSDYDNGPLNEACDCDDPQGCAAARAAAAKVELPTGQELRDMLLDATALPAPEADHSATGVLEALHGIDWGLIAWDVSDAFDKGEYGLDLDPAAIREALPAFVADVLRRQS
jgi:hypothetical protein